MLFFLLVLLTTALPTFAQTPAPVVTSVELTTFTTDDPTAVALPQTQIPVLTVRGTNFFPSSPGPLVTIRRAGFPDMQRIGGGNINGGDAADGWIQVLNVDLSAYPPGSFDVVVTRAPSNAGSHTLTNAFELRPHGPDRLESRGAWGGPINQLHVERNLLYLGAGRRLIVLDATDESNLVELGAIDLKSTVLDFEVRDGRAIVATHGRQMNQLCVVDVRDPANPQVVWNSRHITIPCCNPYVIEPLEVELEGNIAYILSEAAFLHRFDITDPSSPQYLGMVWPWFTNINHFEVENGRLYAMHGGSSSHTVQVYDLSGGPAVQPPLVGSIASPAPSARLKLWQADGGRILCTRSEYIVGPTGYDEGVMVFDVTDPASTVQTLSLQAPLPNVEPRRWIGAAMLPPPGPPADRRGRA